MKRQILCGYSDGDRRKPFAPILAFSAARTLYYSKKRTGILLPFVWRKVYFACHLHLGASLEEAKPDDAALAVVQAAHGIPQSNTGQPVVVRVLVSPT